MPRGRPPATARRRLAAELRAAGLTLAEVGKRLRVSEHGAGYLLRPPRRQPQAIDLRCAGCGTPINPAGAIARDVGKALCLRCLARTPGAPFPQRLKSYRLAAGLARAELADRAGLRRADVGYYEAGDRAPRRAALAALAKALRVSQRDLGAAQLVGRGSGRPRKGK